MLVPLKQAMEIEIINLNSDSEEEAVPLPPAPTKLSFAQSEQQLETAIVLSEPSSSASLSTDFVRRRRKVTRNEIKMETHFPTIKEVNMEFRAAFGVNYSQAKVMNIIQKYIRCLRGLQEVVHKFPNKCGLLSKNVSRTMLLFRGLSRHFCDTPFYLQKMSELLSIYTFFELRFATAFTDSKIRIAERIVTNINLHLESADLSYVLRVFVYIPYMGKESEIVSEIFQRLTPEPLVVVKHELNDSLYIQHLITFYHWKEAEANYDDQQKVVAFASRYMKPMSTLKSSLLYARHLPSYVKREDATSYFLNNLVFFNDLRTASLLDGLTANLPSMIDLSDEMETLSIDYAEVADEKVPDTVPTIKLEEQHIVATVDLTEIDDDAPWLTRLIRRAIETEVKLPRIMTAGQDKAPVIDLDSSDDESWVFDENEENVTIKKKNPDSNSNDSMRNMFSQLETSVDIPDDSTSDATLKELAQNTEKRVVGPECVTETSYSKETRITFKGITEDELNSLPMCSTADPETDVNKNMTVELFGEDEFNKVITEPITTNSFVVDDFSDIPNTQSSKEVTKTTLEDNVTREAVTISTLNLDVFPISNESSEENSEASLGNDNNYPVKTYLKKFCKKPDEEINLFQENVDHSEKIPNADDVNNATNEVSLQEDETQKTPNILFSGKVIPLREDENIGAMTPSYIKVAESIVVSSHGSNVVFSMQGRRLSSFPPLEVTSSSETTVPYFDIENSMDVEETLAGNTKENTTPKVFSDNKPNGNLEVEKPASKRRNVRFADKNDIREIAARETMTSPDSPAAINNITSAINKINGIKQQFQQSQQSTTAPSTITNVNTINNNNNKNPTILQPSTSMRRVTPSSDTAALKTAQEQDLVQQLFPELFAASSNKQTKKKNVASCSNPCHSPPRPSGSPNPFPKARKKPSNASSTITSSNKANSNNSSTSRSNSVTPVPGRPTLSQFDKYLQNLKTRRTKAETKKPDGAKKAAPRRQKKTNKVRINAATKSLVDITNDPKLTKMRPIVLIERLREEVHQANLFRQTNSTPECDAVPKTTQAIVRESRDVTRSPVSNVDNLVTIPSQEAIIDPVDTATVVKFDSKSLTEILKNINPPTLHDIDTTLAALESEDSRMRTADRHDESLPTVDTVVHPVREEFQVEPNVLETPKTVPRTINVKEETEADIQLSGGSFKKPLKNVTSRTLVSARIGNGSPPFLRKLKTPPQSPARTDVAGTSEGSTAGRLEAFTNDRNVNCSDADVQQLPPLNINIYNGSESSQVPTVESHSTVKSMVAVSPKRQVKVRLKRFNFKDSEEYIIVSNTALDDFNQEQSERYQQIAEAHNDAVGTQSEAENEVVPTERKRRVRRSTLRKEKALNRIYISSDRYREPVEEEDNLNPPLFRGTPGHNIDSISTPPPTPPSLTGSPVPSSQNNNTPSNTDEISQQNSQPNAETNNNQAQSSVLRPDISVEEIEHMLAYYMATFPNVIKDFRQNVDMPDELEFNTHAVPQFYKYLLGRNDLLAMESVHYFMPMLEVYVFGTRKLCRKRSDPLHLPSLVLHRTRTLLTSDDGNQSSVNEGTWSTMPKKRRKTICSDRVYLNSSPDEGIGSLYNAVGSSTVEYMRLHTDPQPMSGLVLSDIPEEPDERDNAACSLQSQHHFSDSSSPSPALGNSLSSGSTPVQSDIYECAINSTSTRSKCQSSPDISRSVVVSRTYSKDNMVQHVFVPPEIERCIEDQASVACAGTSLPPPPPPPTVSTRNAARSASSYSGVNRMQIHRYLDNCTSDENISDDDDSKDKDYNCKAEKKTIKSNKNAATKTVRRGRCATKTRTQRKK